MSFYWDVPKSEEAEVIRSLPENPEHCIVHRTGKDGYVVLNMRTRAEYSVRIGDNDVKIFYHSKGRTGG